MKSNRRKEYERPIPPLTREDVEALIEDALELLRVDIVDLVDTMVGDVREDIKHVLKSAADEL